MVEVRGRACGEILRSVACQGVTVWMQCWVSQWRNELPSLSGC